MCSSPSATSFLPAQNESSNPIYLVERDLDANLPEAFLDQEADRLVRHRNIDIESQRRLETVCKSRVR
jgi:hypothetical protein